MSRPPRDARFRVMLEQVWHQLGANRIEERWISDRHGWLGYQEPGKLVISPLNMVPTIIHEALHAAYPRWSEVGVQRGTTVLWDSLADDEAYRIYDAYGRKVVRIARPVNSTEDT